MQIITARWTSWTPRSVFWQIKEEEALAGMVARSFSLDTDLTHASQALRPETGHRKLQCRRTINLLKSDPSFFGTVTPKERAPPSTPFMACAYQAKSVLSDLRKSRGTLPQPDKPTARPRLIF